MDQTGQTRRLEFRLPVDAGSARAARRAVRHAFAGLLDEPTAEDVELLVTELVTNSVRHGARAPAEIGVVVRVGGSAVTVEVMDRGSGFDPATLPGPSAGGDSGWGLALISRVAHRWGIRRTPDGFSVWFTIERPNAA